MGVNNPLALCIGSDVVLIVLLSGNHPLKFSHFSIEHNGASATHTGAKSAIACIRRSLNKIKVGGLPTLKRISPAPQTWLKLLGKGNGSP